MTSEELDSHASLQQLVGRVLSSVEFVQDYFQIRFDGPTINVMNPTSVTVGSTRSQSWDNQFRNMLCGQIGKRVEGVTVAPGKFLNLHFADGSRVDVSLREEDYCCAEAIYFSGFPNDEWGVI